MIVRSLKEMLGTDRDVRTPNWDSRRLMLADDQCGFSLHDTLIRAGTETFMWYKHHIEAVYCVGGKGEVEVLETGDKYVIEDGTMYTLNGHEKHILRAESDMRMICVFNPPLVGEETHDEDGIYPLLKYEPETVAT